MLLHPKLQGKERGEKGGPEKRSKFESWRTKRHGPKTRERRRRTRRFRKLSSENTLGTVQSHPGKTASTRPNGQIPRGLKSRSTHTSSPTVIGGKANVRVSGNGL